jgi:transcriptional regulator with XRE-family HTH domain
MKPGKAISARLKALREAAGLAQQDVAMRADLSLSLVAKIEQGKKADPRASTLLALANALGVKPGALLEDLFPPLAESGAEPDGAGAKKKKDKKKRKKKEQSQEELVEALFETGKGPAEPVGGVPQGATGRSTKGGQPNDCHA